MDYMPCRERTFLHRINFSKYYALYLRWFRHLSERLGLEDTISIWENAFANYDDQYLIGILSYGWSTVESDQSNWTPEKINNRLSACICHFSDHAMMVGPYSIYLPAVLR